MYRRLKNILGVSLMILAIVISQIPMPEAKAEIEKEAANVQAEGTSVVTFSMNGGRFDGDYNGYDFRDKTPVLVIDNGKTINIFPDDKFATYSGYKTDANTWYTDKECLTAYNTENSVTDSITLYKKWYNVTSDGTTLAAKGFHISADGTVLYRYDGEEVLVEIPQTVTVIAEGAFDQLAQDVRGITLPAGIHAIEKNAFRGMQDGSIVYIYDSGTADSINYGKQLAAEYEQLVYSEYLDPEKTEEIAGIPYLSDEQKEEAAESPEGAGTEAGSGNDEESAEGSNDTDIQENDSDTKTTESGSAIESVENDSSTKPADIGGNTDAATDDSSVESEETSTTEEQESSSAETVVQPDQKYTVTFNMNGGRFTGGYNGSSYTDVTSVTTKIAAGKAITSAEYPGNSSSASFKYSNYSTDSNWYKDSECLEVYKSDSVLNGDLTLYKKWYYTSSGFTMNASNDVLYKYSGSVEDVIIPDSITTIGSDAFASVGGISTITLPDNISDVRENAFSGVNNSSKDITITGKTEKARNIAKGLADQYTRLIYEESEDSVVVSRATSGSIKLGATISGSAGVSGQTGNNMSTTGTIVLGVGSVSTATVTTVQPDTVTQPSTTSQETVTVQHPAASTQQGTAVQETGTVQRPDVTSASAPKSTQHIKDSTPKTGDPLQYRMLVVSVMFSVGVLLILTGNGKKKRFSAS